MRTSIFFSSLALIIGLAACKPRSASSSVPVAPSARTEITDVTVDQAEALLKAGGVTVLDVRTPGEFAMERIEGAVNVDFNGANFATELDKLDKSKPYLLHCRSGGRSTRALDTLRDKGFAKIHHLKGGLMAWKQVGKPVQPPAPTPTVPEPPPVLATPPAAVTPEPASAPATPSDPPPVTPSDPPPATPEPAAPETPVKPAKPAPAKR